MHKRRSGSGESHTRPEQSKAGETASCWREKPEWPLSGVKAWVSRGASVDLGVSHEKAIRLLVGNGYLGAH